MSWQIFGGFRMLIKLGICPKNNRSSTTFFKNGSQLRHRIFLFRIILKGYFCKIYPFASLARAVVCSDIFLTDFFCKTRGDLIFFCENGKVKLMGISFKSGFLGSADTEPTLPPWWWWWNNFPMGAKLRTNYGGGGGVTEPKPAIDLMMSDDSWFILSPSFFHFLDTSLSSEV